MTNTKAILGISLTAAFAVTMILAQNVTASSTHFDIEKIELDDFGDFAKLEITTSGDIPVGSGAFGYGAFTAFTEEGAPENVLALTSHVCAADSFSQGDIANEIENCPFAPEGSIGVLEFLRDNVGLDFPQGEIDQANDGPEMHPHILDLTGYSDACSTAVSTAGLDPGDVAVEVDVARTLGTGNNISPNIADDSYTLKVDENELTLGDIPIDESNLLGSELLAYATFNILPLHDGDSNITNLCLVDVSLSLVESEEE